jgi:type I restriction enzyme S subunit
MMDFAGNEGIEFLRLGAVLKRNQGMSVTATQMKTFARGSGEVRVFAGGATFVDTDRSNIPEKGLLEGPAIIVKSRGNIGFEFWTGLYSHKNELWSYTQGESEINLKYVFYYLESRSHQLHELAKSKSVKMPQLAVGDIDSILVPFPSISTQNKIVEILDAMCELQLEIRSELESRNMQFQYYRDALFSRDKY